MTTELVPELAPAEGPAVPEPSAPNIVRLPNGHSVTLQPKVTMDIGMAALSIVKQGGSQAVIEAGLSGVYLRFGIMSWDFRNRDGDPEPVTPENIERLLPYNDGGLEVAEAADALYSEAVLRPLVLRWSKALRTTSTDGSTSALPSTGSRSPASSGPSSRNGTRGKRSAGRGR